MKGYNGYSYKFRMIRSTANDWRRRRKWMYINICIGTFFYGLSQTIYYQTNYLYIRNTVKVNEPDFFYGIAKAIESIGGLISTLLPFYYADKTKNVRQILFIIVGAMLFGNIFYSLYYSPYIVLFGHFLIGCCTGLEAVGYAEIVRVSNPDELTKITSFLTIFTALGHAAGPCLTFIFYLVDVRIAGWKIVVGNMPGISMAVFLSFYFVLMYFTLNNVSKEFTLKDAGDSNYLYEAEEEKNLLTDSLCKTDRYSAVEQNNTADQNTTPKHAFIEPKISFKQEYVFSLNLVRKNIYILILLELCAVLLVNDEIIYLLQPINAAKYLHWDQVNLAGFNLICFIVSIIPASLICTYSADKVNDSII